MSEQDNGLQLAVNNLATEMRRANYLNAIGIGGGKTKRLTLYQGFGYPRTITFSDFYNMYRRNAAGFAVVHRLLVGCWQDYPVIIDGDEAEEAKETNSWEKKVTKLMKKLWSKVKDADRRNIVGRYSALLLQVKDNKSWSEPVDVKLVKTLGKSALAKLVPVMGFVSPATDYVELRLCLETICNVGIDTRILETSSGFALIKPASRLPQGQVLLILSAGRMQFVKLREGH